MTVNHVIDAELGVVFTTLRGAVTFKEFARHLQDLDGDPDFRPDMMELLDGNDAGTDEFDVEQMMSFKDSYVWGPGARRALVCNSDLVFGLFRMFQITSGDAHGEIKLFRDIDEARTWLGLAH